ncbi:MAG TPA: outer membrane beta-barrel protein [Vicinamibacterales bacterium]
MTRLLLLLTALFLAMTSTASAQIIAPDTSTARFHLGPVLIKPVLDLSNLGVDTNVFNEPDGLAKDDVTFTLTPKADIWMKAGPVWLTGNVREDLIWYQTYSSERAANLTTGAGLIVPLNRLSFSVGTSFINAKDRPGYEIDARVPRHEVQVNGAVEFQAFSRTFFGAKGSRDKVNYDDTATFLGVALAVQLDHVTTTGTATARYALTPLTSISIDAGVTQDRFDLSPLRDADSTIAGVQVSFDPSALIKGTARIGYRNFDPVVAGLPAYRGSTANVDLSYVLLGTTKFGVQVTRDVQFSYDIAQPYYLQTGVAASIAQQVYGPVDVVGGFGFYTLAYREREGFDVQFADRTDHNRTVNGGIGYHIGPDLRLGVRIEKQWRTSEDPTREFNGLRYGLAVTYGT